MLKRSRKSLTVDRQERMQRLCWVGSLLWEPCSSLKINWRIICLFCLKLIVECAISRRWSEGTISKSTSCLSDAALQQAKRPIQDCVSIEGERGILPLLQIKYLSCLEKSGRASSFTIWQPLDVTLNTVDGESAFFLLTFSEPRRFVAPISLVTPEEPKSIVSFRLKKLRFDCIHSNCLSLCISVGLLSEELRDTGWRNKHRLLRHVPRRKCWQSGTASSKQSSTSLRSKISASFLNPTCDASFFKFPVSKEWRIEILHQEKIEIQASAEHDLFSSIPLSSGPITTDSSCAEIAICSEVYKVLSFFLIFDCCWHSWAALSSAVFKLHEIFLCRCSLARRVLLLMK